MLLRYIQTALEQAHYEMIEDEEPFYGEVTVLPGVWGKARVSAETCGGR